MDSLFLKGGRHNLSPFYLTHPPYKVEYTYSMSKFSHTPLQSFASCDCADLRKHCLKLPQTIQRFGNFVPACFYLRVNLCVRWNDFKFLHFFSCNQIFSPVNQTEIRLSCKIEYTYSISRCSRNPCASLSYCCSLNA